MKYQWLWTLFTITLILLLLRCLHHIRNTVKATELHDKFHDIFIAPPLRLSIVPPSPSYLFPSSSKSARDISITIVVVLANGRPGAFKSLLNSLSNISNPSKIKLNLKFSISNKVTNGKIHIARTFMWPHGAKEIREDNINSIWNPSSGDEYGLILEDNSEAISPNCIIWIEMILTKILSDTGKKSDRIIGISVAKYLASNVVTIANSLPIAKNYKNIPVLYQAAAMSGVLYFPDLWRMLHDEKTNLNSFSKDLNRNTNELGSLEDSISEVTSKNGLFIVYPNFDVVDPSVSKYPIPSDINAHQRISSANIADYPIFDVEGNPILGRNQLIDAMDWIDVLARGNDSSSYRDNMNTKHGYSHNGILINSLNISFFQQPVVNQQLVSKRYRENVCNSFSKLYEASHVVADPRYITIMISTMHRFPIVLQQILYYSRSPIVSTIIVTWHNMRVPAPKTVLLGKTIIYFVVPSFDSLNNRFLPDVRINTGSVLIIDDDMKVHLDDLQVLHAVWNRHSDHIVGKHDYKKIYYFYYYLIDRFILLGFSSRWFKSLSTPIPHLEYTYNKFKPSPKSSNKTKKSTDK